MAKRTAEEIEAMRKEVTDWDAEADRQAARDKRDAAKPLLDLIAAGGPQQVLEALPAMERVASETRHFPSLRPALNAVRSGLEALLQIADTLPPADKA